MNHLHSLDVLVLGLGDSGLAMARWCARHGAARVRVWDSRETPPGLAALQADVPAAEFITGEIDVDALLSGAHLVLKSPGLAPTDARIAPLLVRATDIGVPVHNELDLFNRALAELKAARRYAPKVLAITGTNGKTTTTALTALLVERAGMRVAMAGNIGPTMLDTLAAALDREPVAVADDDAADAYAAAADDLAGSTATPAHVGPDDTLAEATLADTDAFAEAEALSTDVDVVTPALLAEPLPDPDDEPRVADTDAFAEAPVLSTDEDETPVLFTPPPKEPVFAHLPDVWVLELSSFQLDGVQGFEASAATVLNLSQDHLDWHGDMRAYAAAKARIFGSPAVDANTSTTVMVINRDDPQVEAMIPQPVVVKAEVRKGRGFASRAPKGIARRIVRFGLDAPQHPGDFGIVTENGMAWLVRALESDPTIKRKKGEQEEIFLQRLMPADALRVRGRHNAANALAALALTTAVGLPLAPMLHGLREYTGEPHRVEYVGTVDGVEAFDDSKGTNVGATVAALNGLGADKSPARLAVILGGDGKGQDFAPLLAPVRRHARAVALIGRDAGVIGAALSGSGVPTETHGSLEAAVRWSFEQAQSGDAVLLSPACASFDMFSNYKHRADVFVAEVRAMAADRGETFA